MHLSTILNPTELTAARKALHLSQVELARILGVAVNTVNRWENGSRAIPSYLRLALIGVRWEGIPVETRLLISRIVR